MNKHWLLLITFCSIFLCGYSKIFITGRGCGITTAISKLKAVPSDLTSLPKCTEVEETYFKWQPWIWTNCTGQCGSPGTKTGSRKCLGPNNVEMDPSNCALVLGGAATNGQLCNIQNCPGNLFQSLKLLQFIKVSI